MTHRNRTAARSTPPLLLLMLCVWGCAPALKPIFPPREPPLVWPPPPSTARVRYVGQLRTSDDLKPPPKVLQGLVDLLVGPGEPEAMQGPRGAIRARGGERLWVADPGGRCVHLFDLERREYVRIEQAPDEHLIAPVDVCMADADNVFVCDSEDAAIHRFAAGGEWLESLRVPADILRPVAIAYDQQTDELFVVDSVAHNLKVLHGDGRLRRIIGRRGDAPGQFNYPCDLALDGDLLWIADAGNHRVQAVTRSGEPVIAFGQAGDAPGDLALPKGVAIDGSGNVYVVDARFENVQVFDRRGRLLMAFGHEGGGPGEFWLPSGISIDSGDRIWLCDSYNGRVQVFDCLKPAPAPAATEPGGSAPQSRPAARPE